MSNFNIDDVLSKIDECLDAGANPIAAFDADGTLWDMDMGDLFFDYQIKNKLVEFPENPYEFYQNLKKTAPLSAYLWLAQRNKGVEDSVIKKWSSECVNNARPIPLFKEQQKIISHLQKRNVEVYIVTASIRWAVWGAAKLYEIPEENVIGVSVSVKNGKLTDQQDGPITYKSGKPESLLLRTDGKKPFFTSGNTMGDYELLKISTDIRLVNHAAKKGDAIYDTENKIFEIGKKNNWYTLRH